MIAAMRALIFAENSRRIAASMAVQSRSDSTALIRTPGCAPGASSVAVMTMSQAMSSASRLLATTSTIRSRSGNRSTSSASSRSWSAWYRGQTTTAETARSLVVGCAACSPR